MRVLLVEHDPATAQGIEMMLRSHPSQMHSTCWLGRYIPMDLDLENVIRQALGDALAAGL